MGSGCSKSLGVVEKSKLSCRELFDLGSSSYIKADELHEEGNWEEALKLYLLAKECFLDDQVPIESSFLFLRAISIKERQIIECNSLTNRSSTDSLIVSPY